MDLEDSAKIQNNVTDKPSYRLLGATRNIVSNIFDEVNSNESDDTSTE